MIEYTPLEGVDVGVVAERPHTHGVSDILQRGEAAAIITEFFRTKCVHMIAVKIGEMILSFSVVAVLFGVWENHWHTAYALVYACVLCLVTLGYLYCSRPCTSGCDPSPNVLFLPTCCCLYVWGDQYYSALYVISCASGALHMLPVTVVAIQLAGESALSVASCQPPGTEGYIIGFLVIIASLVKLGVITREACKIHPLFFADLHQMNAAQLKQILFQFFNHDQPMLVVLLMRACGLDWLVEVRPEWNTGAALAKGTHTVTTKPPLTLNRDTTVRLCCLPVCLQLVLVALVNSGYIIYIAIVFIGQEWCWEVRCQLDPNHYGRSQCYPMNNFTHPN